MKKFTEICVIMVIGVIVAVMTAWGMLAIYYSDIPDETLKTCFAGLFGLATISAFIVLPNRRRTLVGFIVVFAALVAWWSLIKPSNNRDWQEDVAVLPYADIQGDLVTIRNIRNFNYRTETDFDPHYYDKTFDLNKLSSVDLITAYWMGDAIAHVMLSFGFGGTDYVTFSIETRKEKTEAYSTVKGFFKQYELFYVVGDERDLIRLRTSFRNPQEDVYLYRLRMPPERRRQLFMEYIKKINELKEKPEFYNTLTTNCTTNVIMHARAYGGTVRYNWKILLSGYTPQYLYELGGLDTSLPFEVLRRRSFINEKAHRADKDPGFSEKIREGLPLPGVLNTGRE
jgi:hypothetical protein